MVASLRDLIPAYNGPVGMDELIPGTKPVASLRMLHSPDVQDINDRADAESGNAFSNAYKMARMGTYANAAAEEESALRSAGGYDNLVRAAQLRDSSLELQGRMRGYAPKAGSYEDVMEQGITSVPGYVAGQLGQMAGSAIDPMAAGVGIGLAGTALSAVPNPYAKLAGQGLRYLAAPAVTYKMNADQLTGEAYNTVAADPTAMQRSPQEIDDEVRAHGYRAAVLDTASQLLPMGQLTKGLPGMISRLPAGAKLAGTAIGEGLTETGQQISQHYAHEALNPDRDTSGDSSENRNSFLGGAIGGGGMGVVGHMGEAGWSRLAEKGDGKNGDVIPLVGKLKETAGKTTTSFEDAQNRANVLNRAMPLGMDLTDQAAMQKWDSEATALQKTALIEELSKRTGDPKAADLLQQVSALDGDDPFSSDEPAFTEAAKYVTAKGSGFSRDEIMAMGSAAQSRKGRKKNEQVAPADLGSNVGGAGTWADTDKSVAAIAARSAANIANQKEQGKLVGLNTKTVMDAFRKNSSETGIPINGQTAALVRELGQEMSVMASIVDPTPGQLARAQRMGKTLATLLGSQTQPVLDLLSTRNQAKPTQTQNTVVPGHHLGAPQVESPVFQAMYDEALKVVESMNDPQAQAKAHQTHDEFAKSLISAMSNAEISKMISKGVNLATQPASREYFAKAIVNYAENPTINQKKQLLELVSASTLNELVKMAGPRLNDDRTVKVESTSGKTAATDSDTAGVNVSESDVSDFEKKQAQKSHDKSPPETLVFHHRRGVGAVTRLKDAFNEVSSGGLPALIVGDVDENGKIIDDSGSTPKNTVPDGRGGSPVERAARLLRNAVKTIRGRSGTWGKAPTEKPDGAGVHRSKHLKGEATGRNHILRMASAKEVMDSANLPDSKRLELMFKYIEQEKGPNVEDLKNMLGVVRSLDAYDRQYSAATIKRGKIGPEGGKLSMGEANELAHPGGKPGTLNTLAGLAATPADAALALSTFTKDTATRNTILMGVVRRAKAEAMKQLKQTDDFKALASGVDGEPDLKAVVDHFFSRRHMAVAEHKSDGDYLKMDLATFSDLTHAGTELLKTASHMGSKKQGKGFQKATQIRAEHEMGLLRWYHSDFSTSKPGSKGDLNDKSARVVIQAKDLVAWVRKQRNDHEISTGKKDKTRGENYGDTRKDEDFLRDLTQGIMGLIDQGLVSGMPYIINGDVHDVTNPTNEVRGFSEDDGSFTLYTNEDGTPNLSKVDPKNLAGREEWFEEAGMTRDFKKLRKAQAEWAKRAATEPNIGPMPTEPEGLKHDGVPPSLQLATRTYKEMVKKRKAGYEIAKQDREDFEATEGPGNKARREKAEQDQHDAEVAGVDYKTREDLLEEDEMTSEAQRRAEAEEIDNTDMQSQEQQDEAEAEAAGENSFADERTHIELMTSVLKSAADRAVSPLNEKSAYGIAGSSVADSLRAGYVNSGADLGKITDAIQRIMAYAKSIDRPTSVPKDTMLTPNPNEAIKDDMLLGGHQYVAPLAMLLTPRFMTQVRKDDMPLFLQLRGFVAKKMLTMMIPDPMSGIPELGGARLATLIDALSGKTDADKQETLDKRVPSDPEQAEKWEASKADRAKWVVKEVPAKNRDAFLQGLIVDVAGRPSVRKRAQFKGTTYESLVQRWQQSAERISNERIAKGEERLAALEDKRNELYRADIALTGKDEKPVSVDAIKKLDAKIAKLSDALDKAKALPTRNQENAAAVGDKTQTVSTTATPARVTPVKRKTPEVVGPTQPAGVQLAANQKRQLEENKGGLGRSTANGPDGRIAATQAEVDADTEQVNLASDKLSAAIEAKVEQLRAKPAVAEAEPPPAVIVSQQIRRKKPAPMGKDLGTLPMYYPIPTEGVREGLRSKYPQGTTTAQLMADGERTATTRKPFGQVGDTFTVEGQKYQIVSVGKIDLKSAEGREAWSQLEGWDTDFAEGKYPSQVRDGATQTVFKKMDSGKVSVVEHPSTGYRERTKHNADSAGLTVAVATNYETAGEKLTRNVAGAKYLAIPLDVAPEKGGLRLAKAMRHLDTATLNVAGNGIYTLAGDGHTQDSINQHMYDLIAAAHKLRPITKIVTGGQTGVDLAGAVAAHKLGIPVVVTMPKGFVQRDALGKDAQHTAAEVQKQIVDGAEALMKGEVAQVAQPAQAEVVQPVQRDAPQEVSAAIAKDGQWTTTETWQTQGEDGWESGENEYVVKKTAKGFVVSINGDVQGTFKTLGEAMKDVPVDTVKQNTMVAAVTPTTFRADPKFHEIIKARAWLQKVLGPDVEVMIEKAFPGMTWNGDWSATKNLIRIASDNPVGVLTVAHHEAVHAFFSRILEKNPEAKALMEATFGTPAMIARLKSTLTDVKHDGSDASKQKLANLIRAIETDPEERAAYGFQLWKMDMLTIDKKPRTFFEKVQSLMRRVFGAVRDSEKALAIMESFDAGKLAEPSAAGMAIGKIMQSGKWRERFLKKFDKLAQAAYSEVMTSESVGLNMGIEAAKEMTLKWYTNPSRAEGADEPGIINRTRMVTDQYINRLDIALKELGGAGAAKDLEALGKALNEHNREIPAHLKPSYKMVQSLLGKYYQYAKEAGVDIGTRLGTAGDSDYYPRVMDLEYLIDHKDEFMAMLQSKYGRVLKVGKASLASDEMPNPTEADVAEKIFNNFVMKEGVDDTAIAVSREDGILNPLFWSGENRNLHWIDDKDIAPFLSTNVVATLTQYLRQGVRAAEYTRTWGRGGEELGALMARKGEAHSVEGAGGKWRKEVYAEDGPVLTQLKEKAVKDKIPESEREAWVERRYEDLQRMNGAMEGSLGKDISSRYRKFQGAIMTYQTLRLLPFMLVSSMLDPNGIRVAGGNSEDMFNAYKRGFTAVWNNWKDMLLGNPASLRDADQDEMVALEAGVVNNLVHLEEMGVVASSEYSAGVTREINHAFFKAVGITHWDRAMRISATRAARRAIGSMIRGDSKEHSARWLKEIGLKPGQGTLDSEGMLISTRRELAAFKGISLEEAAAELVPVHQALNRWVTRAIVSPNAAIRPTRASDPHFAMFYQFKSFTYAFQETTMRYAMHEAENGNLDAGAQLLRGIPIMIASDLAKAMVLGGGSLPSYMAGWTMADWVKHGINRSLGNVATMGVDALSNPMGLFGPTVDQAGDIIAAPFKGEVVKTALNAVPGVRYAKSSLGSMMGV